MTVFSILKCSTIFPTMPLSLPASDIMDNNNLEPLHHGFDDPGYHWEQTSVILDNIPFESVLATTSPFVVAAFSESAAGKYNHKGNKNYICRDEKAPSVEEREHVV